VDHNQSPHYNSCPQGVGSYTSPKCQNEIPKQSNQIRDLLHIIPKVHHSWSRKPSVQIKQGYIWVQIGSKGVLWTYWHLFHQLKHDQKLPR